MGREDDYPLVYSDLPPKPRALSEDEGGLPPLGQQVKVRREKQGRKGKTVTVLFGFQCSDRQAQELGKALRRSLSTGGAVKDGVVEVQGDQLDKVLAWLKAKGYKPQQAGG